MILWCTMALASSAEALEKLDAGEPLTARRLGEEALLLNHDDWIAHYVVATVYYEEDGNLPRAFYHYREADALYIERRVSLDEEAWRTHFYVLKGVAWVARDMEQNQLYLDTVQRFNAMYNPDLLAETGWTLMKMERYDEARAVANTAIEGDDDWQASLGYNVLCAMSTKDRDRQSSADACEITLGHATEADLDITVDAYNTGLSHLSLLSFEKAEAFFQLAGEQGAGSSSNPHTHLAEIFLAQGKGAEAAASLKRMQRWRFAQEPSTRAQSQSEADAMVALVLLAAGESERSGAVIDRVLRRPDRRASTSSNQEVSKSRHLILDRAIRRLQRERLAEEAATLGFLSRTYRWGAAWLPDGRDAYNSVELAGLHTDRNLLLRTVSPYDEDGGVWHTWLIGDLVEPLGSGVVQAAIDEARSLETFPGLDIYFDAFETEIAWKRGQSRMLDLSDRVLANLPETEVLLKARVAARAADHAYRAGDPRAMGLYERALQLDPSTFRRLAMAIPARIEPGPGELDQAIGTILARSPRFSRDSRGFKVQSQAGQVCLISPLGNRIGCHEGQGGADVDEQAVSAVEAFHAGAFSLPLGLSLVDMNSLDGTTHLSTAAKKQALKQVLGGI